MHGIVPGGGLSADGKTWVACRPGFFLPLRVLSRLYRRRFLEELLRPHQTGKLQFLREHVAPADVSAFKAWLVPLRRCEWVVYAKRQFADPAAVLAYLSRYTHRVAISNSRLLAMHERGVTFRWKDYRVKDGAKVGAGGKTRHKTMTLAPRSSCAASCCMCCRRIPPPSAAHRRRPIRRRMAGLDCAGHEVPLRCVQIGPVASAGTTWRHRRRRQAV